MVANLNQIHRTKKIKYVAKVDINLKNVLPCDIWYEMEGKTYDAYDNYVL